MKKKISPSFSPFLVPFCYTVDLSAPSAIMEGSATSPQAPATSTLHPRVTDASQYTAAVNTSAFVSLNENESRAKKPNVTNSGTSSTNNRKKSTMAGASLNVAGEIKKTATPVLPGAADYVKTDRIKVEKKNSLSFPPHTGLTEALPPSLVHIRTAGSGKPQQLCIRP